MNRKSLAWLCACAILAACGSEPPARIFLLATPADVETQSRPNDIAVQLQTVLVPDYADTTDILLRVGPNEITASQTGRWGERLSQGITHALRADLARLMPGGQVTLSPPANPSTAQLLVNVDGFDDWPDGHCVLTAHWTVLRHPADAEGRTGHGVFARPATTPAAVGDVADVAGMAAAVDVLAHAIALDLQRPDRAS